MTIDVDSTVCEVHGHRKGGATYGYTRQPGYHPLLATRADTGEVLHVRQRTGRAASGRGAERFVNESAGRVRRAGATGPLTLRADSGSWAAKVLAALAHNLLRWTGQLGLGTRGLVVAKTLRRYLPTSWPWASEFVRAITRLRVLPAST